MATSHDDDVVNTVDFDDESRTLSTSDEDLQNRIALACEEWAERLVESGWLKIRTAVARERGTETVATRRVRKLLRSVGVTPAS